MSDPAALDADDPLRPFVERFERPDPAVVYLDGNSLGRPPTAVRQVLAAAVDRWATDLVVAWDDWIDHPLTVGDRLAPLVGARPGSTMVGDSTTVCLHRAVLSCVLDRQGSIAAWRGDFPTDRYVVDGIAAATGRLVHWLDDASTPDDLDGSVSVLVGSAARFDTAELIPVADWTAAAHRIGARTVWDLSHAVGAVPVDLDDHGVDIGVGCTYKYLHGGPGAPAFTTLGTEAHDLRPSIQGWFGQREQFAMGVDFDPHPGVAGWRAGTPGMLGLLAAEVGIGTVADAGIDRIRVKSLALGRLVLDRWARDLAPLGVECASPLDDTRRGGHVSLRHPEAGRIVRAARRRGVIADFRAPDLIRLGPGPLAATHAEVDRGMDILVEIVESAAFTALSHDEGRVT